MKILHHAVDDPVLLVILVAEDRDIGLYQVEKLRDDRRDTVEVHSDGSGPPGLQRRGPHTRTRVLSPGGYISSTEGAKIRSASPDSFRQSSSNVRGYFARSSLGANCVGLTKIDATTLWASSLASSGQGHVSRMESSHGGNESDALAAHTPRGDHLAESARMIGDR